MRGLYQAGGTYGIGHASGTTYQASAASNSNVVMSINTSNQTTFGGTVFINGTITNFSRQQQRKRQHGAVFQGKQF